MTCRTEKENADLIKRLNRIEGQIRGIGKMIEKGRDCMDILPQIMSASSALRGVWEVIAASHLEECLANADELERHEVVEKIVKRIKELR